MCGVGALGSTAACSWRILYATLRLVDFDRVESKNLLAQAYTRQAIGRNKAEALRLQLLNFYGVKVAAYPVQARAHVFVAQIGVQRIAFQVPGQLLEFLHLPGAQCLAGFLEL
jgi:molybdopterin/thiamine biosynthesis adenylyltransferase